MKKSRKMNLIALLRKRRKMTVTMLEKAEILAAERVRVVDVALRHAREHGYCSDVNNALRAVYPDHSGPFYDSEGKDCQGYTAEDRNSQRWCRECEMIHR
jgi:hypothetical protein